MRPHLRIVPPGSVRASAITACPAARSGLTLHADDTIARKPTCDSSLVLVSAAIATKEHDHDQKKRH
jgi:hypothetical protein